MLSLILESKLFPWWPKTDSLFCPSSTSWSLVRWKYPQLGGYLPLLMTVDVFFHRRGDGGTSNLILCTWLFSSCAHGFILIISVNLQASLLIPPCCCSAGISTALAWGLDSRAPSTGFSPSIHSAYNIGSKLLGPQSIAPWITNVLFSLFELSRTTLLSSWVAKIIDASLQKKGRAKRPTARWEDNSSTKLLSFKLF